MRHEHFGPLEREIPKIGFGTWNMERDSRGTVHSALRRALELGFVHLDTAELYGSGTVETIVGEAIKGARDRVFLVSKVMPNNASRRGTIAACERSLKRLGTDHLDVYLLHWPGEHPITDTVAAFEELVASGKIKAWGVSNFDVDELEEVVRIAGPRKVTCNQVLYHSKERAIEHAVLPWCLEHQIAVVAYSPFGSGDFPDERSPGGRALAKIAAELRATAHQVALAFLVRRQGVFAIPKTSRPTRVDELWAAGELVLSDAHVRALDAAFPLGKRRGLPTL